MISTAHELAAARNAACLLDGNRRILSCSEELARLVGKTPAELVGRPCSEAFHAPGETPASCPFARMIRSRRPENGFARVAGRPFEVAVTPFLDGSGDITHAVHVFADTEHHAAARQALLKLQSMEHISEISRSIVHDLNGILTVVGGVTMLARTTAAADPAMQGMIRDVEEAIERGGRLCHQLLAACGGDYGTRALVSLKSVIRESAELAALGSGLELAVEIDENLWPCLACEDQIAQLVINLVMNARQASDRGKTIRVTAKNVQGPAGELGHTHFVQIAVADQGSGIAPEHRERIFRPFFTTKQHGTGLGLATVDLIVRRHIGQIGVDSEPGKGTTFTIHLPALDPSGQAPVGDDLFRQCLAQAAFALDLQSAAKPALIEEMIDALAAAGKLPDRGKALAAVLARERSMSTGMENGVALPHGRANSVQGLVIVFGRHRQGVDFASIDGLPTHLFFMTVYASDHASQHVRFLSEISKRLSAESVRRRLLDADSPAEFAAILGEGDSSNPRRG